jgi:phosphatidate cytidylyltransferase
MADDSRRAADARPGDPAEGVRIIGAEEAAEAFERGDVAERRGTHLPRYGDRPARPPAGPKPALRFPLAADDDAETPSLRPAKGKRFDPRPPPAWDEPDVADAEDGDPWPAESTWGEAAWDDDPQADVVAWTRGETGAQPVVPSTDAPAEPGLAWAEDFVDDDDPWDGSWDEPTGAVRWADDEVETAGAAAAAESTDVPDDEPSLDAPAVDLGAPAPLDLTDGGAPANDDWAAFGSADDEPRRARGIFGRRRGGDAADVPVDEIEDGDEVGPEAGPDVGADDATQVGALPGAETPAAIDEPPADDAGVWAPPVASDDDADEPVSDQVDALDPAAAPLDEGLSPWGEPSWGADAVTVGASAPDEPSAPLFDADGGWAGDAEDDDETVFDFADEPSGQVSLPHWTEPGTGELPRILADDGDASVPGTSGSTPAVHWRSHDGAWAGDEDFADLVDADEVRLGAMDLDKPHDEDLYAFDELDEVGAEPPPPPLPPLGDEPGSRRIAPARPVPDDGGAHGGGAGRNLGVATAVGIGAAIVAIALLYLGSAFAMILVVAVLVVGMGEFQAAAHRAGYRPASFLGLAAAVFYPVAVYWRGIEAYPVLMVLTIGAALAWHLVGADGDARVVESVGVTLFGVAWIAGLGSFAGLLLAQQDGRGMLVTAVLAAVGYDVGGLLVGRTMGTRPISDASPNKTVEGLVGGMFMSLFVVIVVVGMFGLAPWDDIGAAAKIGLLAMLAAPLGDLCESLVKRDLGVKDMGDLLPEHGGILDRFDGMLFVLPTVFYAAMLFGLQPF